jgi:hypothetical protein
MPRVEVDVETSLPAERVREALLDFSERRPDIWTGLERDLYEVSSVGETSAEVKEGSKMPGMTVWAKEHYDWSTPGTVRWTVTESNFCVPGSYVAVTMTPREGGGTRVHVEWERTGTTLKGRLLIGMIKLSKGRPVAASMREGFEKLERAGETGVSSSGSDQV